MSKVRINDLARELEVKSKEILDALTAVGVTETKTHSSSIEADEAVKVRRSFSPPAAGAAERRQGPHPRQRRAWDATCRGRPGPATL